MVWYSTETVLALYKAQLREQRQGHGRERRLRAERPERRALSRLRTALAR